MSKRKFVITRGGKLYLRVYNSMFESWTTWKKLAKTFSNIEEAERIADEVGGIVETKSN